MLKLIGKSIALCAIVLGLSGCEALEDALDMNLSYYKPKFQISLNSIVRNPRGNDIERTVRDFYGEELIVNTNAFLTSEKIMDAELIPLDDHPGFYDISLKLNQTAVKLWMQLTVDYRNEPVVILIDDAYFGKFRPEPLYDENAEWVTLKGPFNEVIAKGIVRFTRKNYRHHHPNASDF